MSAPVGVVPARRQERPVGRLIVIVLVVLVVLVLVRVMMRRS